MFLVLGFFLFFSNNIALMLSWYNIFSLIPYPCASRNYLFHSICGIALSAPMSSASADLFVFSFCFYDILIIDTRPFSPIDVVPPMCPHMLSWAAYYESTHYFITFAPSARRISGSLIIRFRSPSSLLSFFQLSLSGFLTLVVRKAIVAVHTSCIRYQ